MPQPETRCRLVIQLQPHSNQNSPQNRRIQTSQHAENLDALSTISRKHPNPGYLGSSSHATIFDSLPRGEDDGTEALVLTPGPPNCSPLEGSIEDAQVSQGALLIEQLKQFPPILQCRRLAEAWIAKGINLALAGSFTKLCAETAGHLLSPYIEGRKDATDASRKLFLNSCQPLEFQADSTIEDFCRQFCHSSGRWETLGLFFTTVSRASVDFGAFEPLYGTRNQRRSFQRLAMHYSDRCLDLSLSLDRLNDLSLVLQYENFINHSWFDGDQSTSTSLDLRSTLKQQAINRGGGLEMLSALYSPWATMSM
ncbi:MAG: hypothetical protein Q9227_004462 [Pyrenula ochraceoflavens]